MRNVQAEHSELEVKIDVSDDSIYGGSVSGAVVTDVGKRALERARRMHEAGALRLDPASCTADDGKSSFFDDCGKAHDTITDASHAPKVSVCNYPGMVRRLDRWCKDWTDGGAWSRAVATMHGARVRLLRRGGISASER